MASNRALETRVEKLERAAGAGDDCAPVIFVDPVGAKGKGELVGIEGGGEEFRRREGESEQDFLARMKMKHRQSGRHCSLFILERRWADDPA